MVITLSVIGSVIFVGAILNITMGELRNKVDINVYFVTTATENDILSLKKKIETLPEVKTIEYTSREKALENFKLVHENDQITLQALEELGDNPLEASLNIKAKEPSQYEGIANFLNEEKYSFFRRPKIIDKINYFENKVAIDKLSRIIDSAERLGLALSFGSGHCFGGYYFQYYSSDYLYFSRRNFSYAIGWCLKNYVKGPFVITGIIVGLISGLITMFIFFPISYWLGNTTQNFFYWFKYF